MKYEIPKLQRFNLVLTLFLPQANSNASTHTNYLIKLLKSVSTFAEQTHNYTGERVSINSPEAPVLSFRGPSERLCSLREPRIIATNA